MAQEFKLGSTLAVTVKKSINRASARKTLERLFMKDKSISMPIEKRSRNFEELPKRRGGQIWTKRPNKIHPTLSRGTSAKIQATPQTLRDLASVSDFVEVASA